MNKRNIKISLVLLGLTITSFLVYSFVPSSYSVSEYFEYLKNPGSGYIKVHELGDIKIEFVYVPAEEEALKQTRNQKLTKEDFSKICNELSSSIVFKIRIECLKGTNPLKYNLNDKEEVFARKKYYDFDFYKDITLLNGKDTIPCELSQNFTNDLGNAIELLVVFSRDKYTNGDLVLSMNEVVFGLGEINQEFKEKILTVKPEINL